MNTSTPKFKAHNFSRTAKIDIPRSRFNLSHSYKTTLDGGFLVPVFCKEALPGDSWSINAQQLCRMTTPLTPFMDNVRATYFFFSVPKRLVWDNFEDFITGSHKGKVGTTHTTYPTHSIASSDWTAGSIYDYMGIPCPATGNTLTVNALPLRAYNLIWNEWFRDENLCTEIALDTGDSDSNNTYALKRRGKRHDYFTSCLPFVQKGPDVSLPLGTSAPVIGNGMVLGLTDGSNNGGLATSGANVVGSFQGLFGANIGTTNSGANLTTSKGIGLTGDAEKSGIYADLSEATASTINSLREAFAVQHLLERDARGGTRYVESLLSHFSVQAPDFRLQRPEYLGGGNITFMVSSVAQTSASVNTSPQGNLSAVAKSVGNVSFNTSFTEHCIVIGLVCITADLTYQQGLDRMWSRSIRTEEYWPEFAHLGEQPVLEKEIYCTGDPTNDDGVFGYQERYAEYRYCPSMITGKLRSTDAQSLDVWHLAQEFQSAPSLSEAFIQEDPPFDRVLAVQNEPQFILDVWFNFNAIRPLPMFSVPSLLDHF